MKCKNKINKTKHTVCRAEEAHCSATYNKGIDVGIGIARTIFSDENERMDECLGY
jgi:hypothetical protein